MFIEFNHSYGAYSCIYLTIFFLNSSFEGNISICRHPSGRLDVIVGLVLSFTVFIKFQEVFPTLSLQGFAETPGKTIFLYCQPVAEPRVHQGGHGPPSDLKKKLYVIFKI